MSIKVACATDDGEKFMDRHFGDADFYSIYQIDRDEVKYIDELINTTEEEQGHADPVKAKGIIKLLKEQGVQAGVSKRFGPNIVRVKKKLVPIIVNNENIEDGLKKIMENYEHLLESVNQGEDREHIKL